MKISLRRAVAVFALATILGPASAFCSPLRRPAAVHSGANLMQQLASALSGLMQIMSEFGLSMDPNGGT